jgi:hypothetical protein
MRTGRPDQQDSLQDDKTGETRIVGMRHPLPETTQILLGDNHGLRDPEGWVARRLLSGRFRGVKIDHRRFMSDADIAAAEESLYARPEPWVTEEPVGPSSFADALSPRSRRRLKRNAR